jgi:hypothetical protein
MKIEPQNQNIQFCGAMSRLGKKAFKVVPNVVTSENATKRLNWFGRNMSSAENRLILGVTALMSQPFIDLNNKKVDEETRLVSCAKTIAKIIAGTITGVLVRKGCIKLVSSWSKIPQLVNGKNTATKKIQTLFTPQGVDINNPDKYKQYLNTVGTIVALFAMTVTNFLIDMPLTKFLTNKFTKIFKENKQ